MEYLHTVKQLIEQGFELRQAPFSITCFDPTGAGDDFAAVVETEREEWQLGEVTDPDLQVQRLYRTQRAKRLPRVMDFPDQISWMLAVARVQMKKVQHGRISGFMIGVETNGVGWPAFRSLATKLGSHRVLGITTVSGTGEQVYQGKKGASMPRLPALDLLRVMIETNRLKMRKDAPGAKELSEEMSAFIWRRAGRPEAIQGQHDDLVMAQAMCLWIGEKILPPTVVWEKSVERNPISAALSSMVH